MRVTLVQQEIIWGNKKHNLEKFGNTARAYYNQTDLLVLPEMFSTGFSVDQPQLAETTSGEAISHVKKWAKEGNYAVAGSIMATDGKRFYNRGFICLPCGTIKFADKRHLFLGDEQKHFTPGKDFLQVTYLNTRIRFLICYDLRFPVWSRNTIKEDGYDLLIYSANWPKDRIDAWDTLLKARAMENQAYVCGVNVVGIDGRNFKHNGHSTLLDPRGKTLVEFNENESSAKTAKIDLHKLQRMREKFTFLYNADSFELITS